MVLTLTRQEVEKLIREKYNLPDEVKVYINDLQSKYKAVQLYHDTDSISDMKVTVNNENQVLSIKEAMKEGTTHVLPESAYADTDSIKKQSVPKKANKTKGKVTHTYPPKLSKEELDAIYERYADIVEQFLKSGEKEQFLDLEGYSASGIRYRYNTAIKMYGFDGQCYASATEHSKGKGTARLIRKEKVK